MRAPGLFDTTQATFTSNPLMQAAAIHLDRNSSVRNFGRMLKGCLSGAACRRKKSRQQSLARISLHDLTCSRLLCRISSSCANRKLCTDGLLERREASNVRTRLAACSGVDAVISYICLPSNNGVLYGVLIG